MRDPVPNAALPRAPNERHREGLRLVGKEDGVRCPTPDCGKKLGEYLSGTYRTICPRCKQLVTITM
jgi:hypothetical protein